MKQTKTDYRNRLQSTTLSTLLTIKLHSNDVNSFDPLPAIHLWNSSKHATGRSRRVNYKEGGLDAIIGNAPPEELDSAEAVQAEIDGEQVEKDENSDSDDSCFSDISDFEGSDSGSALDLDTVLDADMD